MIYGNREYKVSSGPNIYNMGQIWQIIVKGEKIIKTFTDIETDVLFTNKRIIFSYMPHDIIDPMSHKDWTFIPYKSISHYCVTGTSMITNGYLILTVPDIGSLSFYMHNFDEAVQLSKTISEYIDA